MSTKEEANEMFDAVENKDPIWPLNTQYRFDGDGIFLPLSDLQEQVKPSAQAPTDYARRFTTEALNRFLGLPKHECFEKLLLKSFPPLTLFSTTQRIQDFILKECGRKDKDGNRIIKPGGMHHYFRDIRTMFNWAYSPGSGLNLDPTKNPITWVVPPEVPRRKMPAQNRKSVETLLAYVLKHSKHPNRDASFISELFDSSGRLTECANTREGDIDWQNHTIRAIAKGNIEVDMPFGEFTEYLLKTWLAEHRPGPDETIWGITKDGLVDMLVRLEKATDIKCNAHTFRRGFACEQRRMGVDTMDIAKLGHWKSLEMVKRYTESVEFEDAQKHYKAPTSRLDFQSAALPTELPRQTR